jgi:hypothetical protein
MNTITKYLITLIAIFTVGLLWGILYANDPEPVVDCCTSCTDYCKCLDGIIPQAIGCYTIACPGKDCEGVGVKCCFPTFKFDD